MSAGDRIPRVFRYNKGSVWVLFAGGILSDTILKTVLSGILLFSSFQASAADNSGAVLMSQAQQTLRATFSDPTFPDSYYPGRALFEQKITKIRHPAFCYQLETSLVL